jgi:hypothetical protein
MAIPCVLSISCAGAIRPFPTRDDGGFAYVFLVPRPVDRRTVPELWNRRRAG